MERTAILGANAEPCVTRCCPPVGPRCLRPAGTTECSHGLQPVVKEREENLRPRGTMEFVPFSNLHLRQKPWALDSLEIMELVMEVEEWGD